MYTNQFLPTPSHGGRQNRLILLTVWPGFLPTPSHGGRHGQQWDCDEGDFISTHALTWRATAKADKIIKELWDFYPRPHMEGDGAAIV